MITRADAATPTAAPASPTVRSSGRLRRRIFASAIVALVVAGVIVALVYRHWKTTADYLFTYAGISETQSRWPAGRPLYVNTDVQPHSRSGHRELDVRSIAPRVVTNTAGARIVLISCPVTDPHLGMGTGPKPTPCASTRLFRPGKFDVGFPATEFVYRIIATRPGRIEIDGADVSYCGSGRCGNQHAGSGIVIHVVPTA